MATAKHMGPSQSGVKRVHDSGPHGLVVTVSAMGKQTDRLLRLAGEVVEILRRVRSTSYSRRASSSPSHFSRWPCTTGASPPPL